jgi:hypothetical protein
LSRPLSAALVATAVLGVLPGCRILVGTAVVGVGAVGLVGYGVYKTGEAAVTGVGSVVSGGAKSVGSVVFLNGEFKATCRATVDEVWLATVRTLKANGFELESGDRDALSGYVNAVSRNNQPIAIKLDATGRQETLFRMRIGVSGDLKKSETLYGMIEDDLGFRRRGNP